jgi:hypothetical protein
MIWKREDVGVGEMIGVEEETVVWRCIGGVCKSPESIAEISLFRLC